LPQLLSDCLRVVVILRKETTKVFKDINAL
jgi:hypothetical protein